MAKRKFLYKRVTVNGKTMLEHRHLIEKDIGRILTKKEWIHHKDEIPTNNDLKNLQITNAKEHNLIHHKKEIKYIKLMCPICKKEFLKKEKRHLWDINKGIKNFYCSIVCRDKGYKGYNDKKTSIDYVKKIEQGLKDNLNGCQISNKYNINKATVYNHLREMNYKKINNSKLQDGLYRCAKCNKYLSKEAFHKNKTKKYGIHTFCKSCRQ